MPRPRRPQSPGGALHGLYHKDVAADVARHAGFHGRLQGIDGAQCKACHSDASAAMPTWFKLSPAVVRPVRRTDFPLARRSRLLRLARAATSPAASTGEAPTACNDCHRADDPHEHGKLGARTAPRATKRRAGSAPASTTTTRLRPARRAPKGRLRGLPCRQPLCRILRSARPCHAPDDVHRGARGPECCHCHGDRRPGRTSKFDHARKGRVSTGPRARTTRLARAATRPPT